jgi:hypothetical protein
MKPHPTFTNYLITENGEVMNKKTNRTLKPRTNEKGYRVVGLVKDKKKHNKRVNRLVLETYNPIENDHLYDAHHENEIKNDNRLENLKWELKGEHNREHQKGKVFSEETKKKMSERRMGKPNQGVVGKFWWNNGVKTIRSKETPGDGWVRGRL